MKGQPAGHGGPAPKPDEVEREKIGHYIRLFSTWRQDALDLAEAGAVIVEYLKMEYRAIDHPPDIPDAPAILERDNIEERIAAYLRGNSGHTAAEIRQALRLDIDGETVLYASDRFLLGNDHRWHCVDCSAEKRKPKFNAYPNMKGDDDESL